MFVGDGDGFGDGCCSFCVCLLGVAGHALEKGLLWALKSPFVKPYSSFPALVSTSLASFGKDCSSDTPICKDCSLGAR